MAGDIIRPSALVIERTTPVASEYMVVDNGTTVAKSKISDVVKSGRPAASQAEAVAGTDAVKVITSLTSKQSIASEVGVSLASKAQGDKADSAVQPGDLATVATSGAYADLSGKPALGTAASHDATDFATAAQGVLAGSAVQPADLALVATTGDYADLDNKPPIPPALADGDKGDVLVTSSGATWRVNRRFDTVAALIADSGMVYVAAPGKVLVAAGNIVDAQGYRYAVAASSATDQHITTSGGVKLYVNPRDGSFCSSAFGVVGDGVANDTVQMQKAVDVASASSSAGRLIIDKAGTYLLDQLVLKPNCTVIGADRGGVVLKYSGAALTPVPAYPGIAVAVQMYKAFVRTATAGQLNQWTDRIGIENLTIDWANKAAGGYAGTLLWFGNARNIEAKRLKFINCLPSDYDIVSSAGRGASLFMSYVEGGLIEGCEFTDAASYEELGIRYYNKDITVQRNHFAGNGPWRHNIEVAAVRDLSLISAWPKGILIQDNLFELRGNKQDVLSCHDGGDVVFKNNRVMVMGDLVDTTQSGFRSLVKRFDNEDGIVEGSLLVDGNSFDFRSVPTSVKRAFEVVRIWTSNVTVVNNLIRGKTDGFDNSLQDMGFYPWVGAGDNHYNPRNIIVSNNQFELYEYSASYSFQIIKMTGNGVAAFGNTLNVKVPITVTTNGPVFIDLHGANAGGGGNPPADGLGGGKATSVIGNTSYANSPNAIITHINIRGNTGQAQYVAMGNPSNCAVNLLGTSPYLSGSTGDEMRVAIGNIGAGVGAQQYRYHTFTWNPASINAAAQTSVDVPISGVNLGDEISASFSLDLQFCTLTAYAYSAGNVRVVLTNTSASAKDLASGTVTLRIRNRM